MRSRLTQCTGSFGSPRHLSVPLQSGRIAKVRTVENLSFHREQAMYLWSIILLLLIASIVLPPVALWWLSQRSKFSPFLHGLATVEPPFMGVMGVLFSLNLVFVCNEVWQSRETAKLAMLRESEALFNIASIAANIPGRGGIPLMEAAREYAEAAIAFDFPRGGAPAEGAAPTSLTRSSLPAIDQLTRVILDVAVLEKMHAAVRSQLLSQLETVRDKRLERLVLTEIAPNKVKWLLLVFLGFVTLLSIALVHITNARALLVACLVYVFAINSFIGSLYYCQSPFAGFDPLTDSRLAMTLVRLRSMEQSCKNTEFADSTC